MSTAAELQALGYQVEFGGEVVAVTGFGVATMAHVEDTATFESLADPAAHTERRFQFVEPAATAARADLEAAEYTVVRDNPTIDVFTVTPPTGSADMTPTTQTPTGLEALAATLATGG